GAAQGACGSGVLVASSAADPVNVWGGLEAGADGFMTKDLEPAEVVGRVRRVLAADGQPAGSGRDARRDVRFLDRQFEISAGREQLLSVLLSAFEDVVHLNQRYQEELAQRRRMEQALAEERN